MNAQAAIGTGATLAETLDSLIEQMPMAAGGGGVDLALLFASDAYAAEYGDMLSAVRERTGAKLVIGCSGQGVIGPGREIEDRPAIALQLFSLPGAVLEPVRFDAIELGSPDPYDACLRRLGEVSDLNALLMFVDPFSVDGERLLSTIGDIREDLPLAGGLASARSNPRNTYLFLDGEVYEDGAVAVAMRGAYTVRTVVSQGAAPLGETWTITEVEGNVIHSIGMRPALEVLNETFLALTPEVQMRARRNLLIGLAMNEYKDEFRRGDFLIRNLVGIDRETGSIAIGAMPRVGQTIQFQLRDPDAADDELRVMLSRARQELEGEDVAGALLCSCNGRGVGLFGAPDHDAKAVQEAFGTLPVAGFFCNGEIGPVGGTNFLHGFTASIALIVPKE